ncbi:hypothetical protein [Streptomyces albicerus]|uniref:hypothetical protein n=1 Tax=Streptomyces albicerus TaxID=2569859 RepID=UPI00298E5B78|nr:hypothetical protein [Streptomyces albicerus]
MSVVDSDIGRFTLISGRGEPSGTAGQEEGLADVLTLQRRGFHPSSREAEEALYQDTLAEYCWARDVAGLAATTLNQLVQPVIEICSFHGVLPWELSSRMLDQYFAGPGKRAHSTVRKKITSIDQYFAFLEQRYAGEILRRFGAAVESPVDAFNRPRHRGISGCGFLRRGPRRRRSSAPGARSWRRRASIRWPSATT